VVGDLDPNFGWCDGRLFDAADCQPGTAPPNGLRGAFSCVNFDSGGRCHLVRDPLGINKLFWSMADDGVVVMAARPHRLVNVGCRFESVKAIPAGAVVDLDPCLRVSRHLTVRLEMGMVRDQGQRPIEILAAKIRSTLDRYAAALAAAHSHATVFVCLSGGLDSSGVAVLAREHFRNVVGVSFDLQRPGYAPSEDRATAEHLAKDIGIPLLCVTVTEDELLEPLDTVLVEGSDWRDFNVHAALVNAALARGIAASCSGPSVVLTGDFPNEFLVDYHPETYRGEVYYRLPRLALAALQMALVRGLETSHREVGPFQAWGLPVLQPYAVAADHYVALPSAFLSLPDRKQRLSRMIFGNKIPSYVYSRPKARAQVGGGAVGGGVLAACIDNGIDDAWLRRRFAELHYVTDITALDRFIRGGRYRAMIPFAPELV
jgi:asparagine synthetase B (glutamine-hydrolysing)